MLYAEILRQRLKLVNAHIVADTIDYLEAKFEFRTEDWDGLDKWAHFAKDSAVYDIRLTDNCIRKEDHLNLSAGMWKVYLHGNEFRDGEVVQRITTDEVVLYVIPTGILDGEPFPTVPPSAGEQIIAAAVAAEARAKQSADEAGRAAGSAKDSADLAAKSAAEAKKSVETVGNADQIIQDALRDAKESGEFDGEDGITPHIGANGNWFVGETDTGIRAQGKDGKKGDPGDDYILTAEDKQEIAGLIPGGGNVGNVLILVGGASLENLRIEFVAPPAGVSVEAAYELIGRGLFDVAVQTYSDDGIAQTGIGLLRGMPVGDAVGAIGEFWSNGNVSLVNVTLDFAAMTAYAETMYTSSGGGGVVTITQDADGSYTCSHTPAEIAAMAQTGAVVAGVPVTDGGMIILPLIGISFGIAMFVVTFSEDDNIGTMMFFVGDDAVVSQEDENRVAPMTGASAADGGKPGTVPAPAAGQQDAVLHGDGTWRKVEGGTSVEIDSTLTQAGKAADAKTTGEKISNLSKAIADLKPGGMSATSANLLITILRNGTYITDQSDNIDALAAALSGEVVEPDSPDEPIEPEVTLVSITAAYTGGDVVVGTALTDLTGISVIATYSDGSTATVTDYTLTGEITEGDNTIIVTYEGLTATFTVTGYVEATYPFTPGEPYAITWTSGYKVDNSTGADATDSGMAVSDYLPCEGASAFEVGTGVYLNYGLFFYDSDKNFLGRNGNQNFPGNGYAIDMKYPAAYVRAQKRTSATSGYTVTPVMYPVLTDSTPWEAGVTYNGDMALGSLSISTGAENNSSWYRSGFILCYGATTLSILPYDAGFRASVCWYDSQRNFISGATTNGHAADAVPENAYYFRFASAVYKPFFTLA